MTRDHAAEPVPPLPSVLTRRNSRPTCGTRRALSTGMPRGAQPQGNGSAASAFSHPDTDRVDSPYADTMRVDAQQVDMDAAAGVPAREWRDPAIRLELGPAPQPNHEN